MKRLPLFIIITSLFALTACQKETTTELDAILEHEMLQEEVQQIAILSGAEASAIMADKTNPACNAVGFTEALARFVAANQKKANETCETVKGPVSGCFEGYMTYATALVFPDINECQDFIKPDVNIH